MLHVSLFRVLLGFGLLIFLNACEEPKEYVIIESGQEGRLKYEVFSDPDVDLFDMFINEFTDIRIEIAPLGGVLGVSQLSISIEESEGFSVKSNDCSTNIPLGEPCELVIEAGNPNEHFYSTKVTVQYNGGFGNFSFEIPLEIRVGSVALIQGVSGYTDNFGVVDPGGIGVIEVFLENRGGVRARDVTASIEGDGAMQFHGGSYPGTGGTCGDSIGYQEVCSVFLSLNPIVEREHSNDLVISYDNRQIADRQTLSFEGVSDEVIGELRFLGVTGAYDFDKILLGERISHTLSLNNFGYLDATDIDILLPDYIQIKNNECVGSLAATESCDIEFEFVPLLLGQFDEPITVTYHNTRESASFEFSALGEAESPGFIETTVSFVEASSYDFGLVGINDVKQVEVLVKNLGDVNIENLTLGGVSSPYQILESSCTSTLSSNSTCGLLIQYSPLSQGVHENSLEFSFFNGVEENTSYFQVTARADILGVLKVVDHIEGEFENFEDILAGEIGSRSFVLKNIGLGDSLDITYGSLTDPFSFEGGWPGLLGDCPVEAFSLSPGESCVFSVTLMPGVAGVFADFFDFASNDTAQEQVYRFRVKGKVESESNIVSREGVPRDFGPVPMGVDRFFSLTLENIGSTPASNIRMSFEKGTYFSFTGGAAPGVAENGTIRCDLLLLNGECRVYLTVNSNLELIENDKLIVLYDGAHENDIRLEVELIASFEPLGYLEFTGIPAAQDILEVPTGGQDTLVIGVHNNGLGEVSQIEVVDFEEPAFTLASSDCPLILEAGESCTLNIDVSSTLRGLVRQDLLVNYHDNRLERFVEDIMRVEFVRPAKLVFSEEPLLDFGTIVVGEFVDRLIRIRNTGEFDASVVSFQNPSSPYSIQANSCPSEIVPQEICEVILRYSPNVVGVEHLSNLGAAYFDGAENQENLLPIRGIAEPPLHVHGGWVKIEAFGNRVNILNTSLNDRAVHLEWSPMVIDSGSFESYSVFRRRADNPEYDFEDPLAENIGLASLQYTDIDVSNNTAYYYTVRPIAGGFPSRSLQTFSEIRVVVPPENMSLLHRRIVNKDFCENISQISDKTNHNRCLFFGPGSSNGYYDFGKDLLVDRFELGADLTSRFGQNPAANLDQDSAMLACQNQGVFTPNGMFGTISKRTLRKSEQYIASAWPDNLSPLDIEYIQRGNRVSNRCNGNDTSLEKTGTNTECVSKYGLFDAAGNVWEWMSDRTYRGFGVIEDNQRVDLMNKDFDGISFLGHQEQGLLEDITDCFSQSLGIPVSPEGSVCPEGSEVTDFYGVENFYDSRYYPPSDVGASGLLVGGSINPSTNPSNLTLGFAPITFSFAGTRCALEIPY